MARISKERDRGTKSNKLQPAGEKISTITPDQSVEKELSVLEKLSEWHKRSEKTRWIIGEYLNS